MEPERRKLRSPVKAEAGTWLLLVPACSSSGAGIGMPRASVPGAAVWCVPVKLSWLPPCAARLEAPPAAAGPLSARTRPRPCPAASAGHGSPGLSVIVICKNISK